MIFCGDVRNVQGLVYAGVTVATIANNHIGNYGVEGIDSTVKLLTQNNIQTTGNGVPAIITIKDKKFGFLGYNDIGHEEQGISWAHPAQIQKDIQALKQQTDFIIVAFHWGVEYTSTPDSIRMWR
jgi:poly-gamma-glutamate capsule biosynthesis protein CapA/YwtB (metallophosphatase superfamily)